MNHADRTRITQAIASQTRNLQGPLGLDALLAAVQVKPAPKEQKNRPIAPNGTGGIGHADPTPTEAVDPTRANTVLAYVDIRLELILEQLDEIVNKCNTEIRRSTTKEPPPKQLDRRWCVDCARGKTASGKHLEVPIDPDGDYREQCKFCGRWKAEHKHRIPVGVCEYRDRYGETRLTTKAIADAYRAENRPVPPEFLPVSTG